MKYCHKCKGTGRILEKRLSDYVNSYDYYPVNCSDCQNNQSTSGVTNLFINQR